MVVYSEFSDRKNPIYIICKCVSKSTASSSGRSTNGDEESGKRKAESAKITTLVMQEQPISQIIPCCAWVEANLIDDKRNLNLNCNIVDCSNSFSQHQVIFKVT